jgi:hypothetical protein
MKGKVERSWIVSSGSGDAAAGRPRDTQDGLREP